MQQPGWWTPPERRPAVAALLRLVAVPGAQLLAPWDRGIGPAVDDDRVGQTADPLGHLATTVRTNGHDSPLFNPGADPFRLVSHWRGYAGRRARPALRFAHGDSEER